MPAPLHRFRVSLAALAALAWAVAGIVMTALAADPPASDKLPAELSGKVVAVHDADTITVLVGRQQYKVRLAAIDAPELGQDYGRKAKQAQACRDSSQSRSITPAVIVTKPAPPVWPDDGKQVSGHCSTTPKQFPPTMIHHARS